MKCSGRGLPALLRYAEFDASTPERRAFRSLLQGVARALGEIERADDHEPTGARDAEAIRDCLAEAGAAWQALQALQRSEQLAGQRADQDVEVGAG